MNQNLMNKKFQSDRKIHGLPILLFILLVLLFAGCRNLGPNSIYSNRESYIEALSQTDKEEMLANIVRAKYNDPPKFLKIKTISAAPSLELGAESEFRFTPENFAVLKPKLNYKESPTIIYAPLMGTEYSTQLLMPMGLVNLFLMLSNGFDTEVVCDLMITSINGKSNSRSASDSVRSEFKKVIVSLKRLSEKKLIHFATSGNPNKEKEPSFLIDITDDAMETDDFKYLAKKLELEYKAGPIEMVMGFNQKEKVFAVNTRSFLALINYLSNFVEVPEKHKNIVWQGGILPDSGQIHILCSDKMPENANTAVFLYNHWYYIKSDDISSQNILYLIQILFELQAHIGSSSGNIQLTMPIR